MAGKQVSPHDLITRHRSNGVLLDTNLLLLLALGGLDRKLIGRGRISEFDIEDFKRLNMVVRSFQSRLTTPNILTEVDDLGRKNVKGRELQYRSILKKLELQMVEKLIPSRTVFADPDDTWLGLADGASLKIDKPFLLLTTDADLWSKANRSKVDAVNWNHLRMQWL